MDSYPELTSQGFQILEAIGQNRGAGRITYKALRIKDQQTVVIKLFWFGSGSGDWSHYKAIEREAQALQDLKHPGIPRYLGSFSCDAGLCLVQQYIDAQTLAIPRSFSPDQIKQIAVSILEILVYLQQRIPPVIHRDIKPENILVSRDLDIYLVDFGFARIGEGEVFAPSSMVAGTLGFMAPEQKLNRTLTKASDQICI